jgi:hypothetical protein
MALIGLTTLIHRCVFKMRYWCIERSPFTSLTPKSSPSLPSTCESLVGANVHLEAGSHSQALHTSQFTP